MKEIANVLGWETTALILSARDEAKPTEPDYIRLGSFQCSHCNGNLSTQGCSVSRCFSINRRLGPAGASQVDIELTVAEGVISGLFGEEIRALEG